MDRTRSRLRHWVRAAAWAGIAGLTVSFAVSIVSTLVVDPTCSRGLCDSDLLGPYKLATMWLPMGFAVLAVLIPAWIWRPRN